MLDKAGREAEEYSGQMKYLNIQKQKFLNDAYSLLIEFGKVIDRAQEDIEAESHPAEVQVPSGGLTPETPPQYPEDSNDEA